MNKKIYLPLTEKMFYFGTNHTILNQTNDSWWTLRMEIESDLKREITNLIYYE